MMLRNLTATPVCYRFAGRVMRLPVGDSDVARSMAFHVLSQNPLKVARVPKTVAVVEPVKKPKKDKTTAAKAATTAKGKPKPSAVTTTTTSAPETTKCLLCGLIYDPANPLPCPKPTGPDDMRQDGRDYMRCTYKPPTDEQLPLASSDGTT